jgi:hypothetical protein
MDANRSALPPSTSTVAVDRGRRADRLLARISGDSTAILLWGLLSLLPALILVVVDDLTEKVKEPGLLSQLPHKRILASLSVPLGIGSLLGWFCFFRYLSQFVGRGPLVFWMYAHYWWVPISLIVISVAGYLAGRASRLSPERRLALAGMGVALIGQIVSALVVVLTLLALAQGNFRHMGDFE